MNTALKEAAPSSEPRDLLGVEVANFRVERRLGRGGMADVYLLRHQRLPSTCVAMKVLRGAKLGPGEWFEARHTGLRTGAEPLDALLTARFKQEAHIAAELGAPSVAAPLDIGQLDDGTPYILMEYVSGRSLEERLAAEGALPVRDALEIALAVADTMARAHARGIVHRDLKPSNIMLSDDGLVRLLDFGVARVSGTLSLVHTTERAVLGTPGYIAPEVLSGYEAEESSDVFSLGVTLFKMLTNTLPFPTRTSLATAENLLSGASPPLASRRSPTLDAVPANVEELVQRMLAREPGSRPSMATLAVAWRAEATAPSSVSAKARGWRWRIAATFAVVMGVSLVQARAYTEPRPERLRKANEHLMASLTHALPAPVSEKPAIGTPQPSNAKLAPPTAAPSSSARPQRRSRRAPAGPLKVVDPVDWMEE